MTDWVIEATGLSRHFGDIRAVQDLDIRVEKRCIYGFLGPNGSGKTTAIRLLTGLLRPTTGQIEVLGHRLPGDAAKLRHHIGYMTQRFSLYDDLTVSENLQFVARIYGFSRQQQSRRIRELLSIYDLQAQQSQLVGNMSGGQRQRLALAAATLHKPELLFLDEPTSAVDPETRREFWEQLFDLSDDGATILVSTHYMDEAERCHRLAILDEGVKRADGSPQELMANMGAQVVEITDRNIRQWKQALAVLPQVVSAAQLGTRLRVLVRDTVTEPIGFLQQQPCFSEHCQMLVVRPSLEDVFVVSTGRDMEHSGTAAVASQGSTRL